ncbi:hypothetical protein [Sorangium sp. So ce854]|uniref:hypothetical protein n=1 Tax=Sorangium sp. So ce854 TaxID=3133322 RepID=UPI003F5E4510
MSEPPAWGTGRVPASSSSSTPRARSPSARAPPPSPPARRDARFVKELMLEVAAVSILYGERVRGAAALR